MPHITKAVIDDVGNHIEITGIDGSQFSLPPTRLGEMFSQLAALRTQSNASDMSFTKSSTLPTPPTQAAEFHLSLNTTSGRTWQQDLRYVVADGRLSMTSSGITGYWNEAEIAPIADMRKQLIRNYGEHSVIGLSATWNSA